MDFDKLGPIVLFIGYMVISAWAKQKKARQRSKPTETPSAEPSQPRSNPVQGVGGILDQLKKELFEIDEEPLVFQQAIPEYEAEEEVEIPVLEPEPELSSQFSEGSEPHSHVHLQSTATNPVETATFGQSLEEVLEPYSKIEQGMILHEILGKPRARQENDEWFHRS